MSVLAPPPSDLAPRVFSNNPADFAVPTGREEEWRFTPVKELQDFFEPQAWNSLGGSSSSSFVATVPVAEVDCEWRATDRPAAIARAGVRTAIRVFVPANEVVAEPIMVDLTAEGPGYGHVSVELGRFAQATVVLKHDMSNDCAGNIVVNVGDGADLTLLSVMDGASEARQLWHWETTLQRDSRFVGLSISLSGRIVRMLPVVRYAAPGASAELLGAFLTDGSDFQEHRILVDHSQPHCTSKVIYKGALSGESSHTVWIGDVLVRREAVGIETYELNRNLLLNDGPRADSVPNLELETGDVAGAGHASATGRFDDEQLFYLQSRGIPETVARQLVVRGFFVEVLNRIADANVRSALLTSIEERLGMQESEA